jgi:hypothetical protein
MANQLPAKVDTLEELPEAIHEYYEETEGGTFVLAIDGVPPQAQKKVAEFRDNNIQLSNQIKDMEERMKTYDGLDPDKAREALDRLRAMEEKEMIEKGDVESLVHQKLEEERRNYAKQIEQLRKSKDEIEQQSKTYRTQLANTVIENRVMQAVQEVATPHQTALTDILSRAKSQWRLGDDGELYAVDESGSRIYNKAGDEPISTHEWSKNLSQNASHLFQNSQGTGSFGSINKSNIRGKNNPWSPDNYNLTEQTKIYKQNKELAKKMAHEYGVSI